jgi:signal transduction histidine kinase
MAEEEKKTIAKNKTSSIARKINRDYMIRNLFFVMWLDLALVTAAVLLFFVNSHRKVPDSAFENDYLDIVFVFKDETSADFYTKEQPGVDDLIYRITLEDGTRYEFSVRDYVDIVYPLYTLIFIFEVVWLCFGLFKTKKVRRRMRPLYDVALQADAVSRMAGKAGSRSMSESNMRHLESAINHADPNAPIINTGDKELAGIEIALNNLLRDMEESRKQQVRFVSDASHELRTPIAVIQGYVNMLDRWGKEDEEVLTESIEALKNESEHMKELVEQLLFLARGDSGRNTLQRKDFDLAKVIFEVWEESIMIDEKHKYAFIVDGKRVTDIAEYEESIARSDNTDKDGNCMNYMINGDVAMIKQSSRIFLQNAAKYSEAGSEIRIKINRNDDATVSYSIQDEGIGLTQDQLDHVFERFYRSDEARNADTGGTGLGLSIAKWIVDAHEAKIDVISRADVGTRFTVSFPGIFRELEDKELGVQFGD